GPMARDVAGCARMLAALAPGFEPRQLGSLKEIEVGVAWLDDCDPLVRERVEAAAACFPRRHPLDVPATRDRSDFMREVADVHRELFAEYPELYGSDVRRKVERCLEVSEDEHARASASREEYRAAFEAAVASVDLLVTPTLGLVAPPVGAREDDALRRRLLARTLSINAVGWPA